MENPSSSFNNERMATKLYNRYKKDDIVGIMIYYYNIFYRYIIFTEMNNILSIISTSLEKPNKCITFILDYIRNTKIPEYSVSTDKNSNIVLEMTNSDNELYRRSIPETYVYDFPKR